MRSQWVGKLLTPPKRRVTSMQSMDLGYPRDDQRKQCCLEMTMSSQTSQNKYFPQNELKINYFKGAVRGAPLAFKLLTN